MATNPSLLTRLTARCFDYRGAIHVGALIDGDKALLFDYGDGSVIEALKAVGVRRVERICFTHHHRDQAIGLLKNRPEGASVVAPEAERDWFANVESFWNDPKRRWHLYNDHPHPLMLPESVSVERTVADVDSFQWGEATITVIATPGHTDGSVSYLVEVDGERIVFCGDLIYDHGRLWELYSLQKGENRLSDYHGFLGARKEWGESLRRVAALSPSRLVPSHGEVMDDPIVAIDAVLERVERCYDTYVGISALRHYFPDMFREFEGRPNHMPFTEKLDVPDFLYHWGTTWAIRAENGELFVMDCGAPRVIEEIDKRVESGEISGVTEFWITHYHDDHVDQVPALQQKFDCVTRADRVVADVVSNPLAYRFPCISEAVCRIDHITDDGDSWGWNEFTMTAFHFPGQTFYHGGLLVEGRGVRLFFSGDSFTPSGIDDYCAANRNLLGIDFGYERCLDVLDETQPTHIFNCHVDCAFRFSEDEMRQMRRNLHHRETAFGELFAWDHPNYGMDPHWVRAHPYEQSAVAGATITLAVELTNHSDEARVAVVKPMPPNGWGDAPPQTAVIPPKRVGKVVFRIAIPPNETPRRLVIPFDLVYDRRPLPAFREAVVVVHEEPNRASSR